MPGDACRKNHNQDSIDSSHEALKSIGAPFSKLLPSMSPLDQPIIRRFIEDAGNTTQALGVGRVVGQIFAYLYFSEESRTLDDMKEALGISKGSASMGVRQLEQWGAVQRVWVKGDRKDFYTANDYFGQIVRNIAIDLMGKRIASLAQSLDSAEAELDAAASQTIDHRPSTIDHERSRHDSPSKGRGSNVDGRWSSSADLNANHKFIRDRINRLRAFQGKVQSVWGNPIVKMILK